MNELDKLMAEYPPLSESLTTEEIKRLKNHVLEKSRTGRKPRRLLFILAAAMCLLAACGAAALGLFDSMTGTNNTSALVEKYGVSLEDAPSAQADGHTVTIRAILRSDTIARVIYDVSGSRREINSWDRFRNADGDVIRRVQFLTNGCPSGHTDELPGNSQVGYNQLRQSGPVGKVSGDNACRWYADLDLTGDADSISVYLLSEENGAEVIRLPLPDAVAERRLTLSDAPLTLTRGKEEVSCQIRQILITPFRITIQGTHDNLDTFLNLDTDWNDLVKLYDANGTELRTGKDGDFYALAGGIGETDFTVELNCYDLLDPADVAEVELDGVRYPLP